MGGVLTHSLFSVICAFFIYSYFKIFNKKEFYLEHHLERINKSKNIFKKFFYHKIFLYSFSFFIGHIIVDSIKFIFSAIRQGTLKIFSVKHDAFFNFLATTTNNFVNWSFMGFIFFIIFFYLFKKHIINKKSFFELDNIIIFFLIGVLTHLILDLLIYEKSAWF